MDADDVLIGEDFTSETLIVRWAVDPAGRTCQVLAEVPGTASLPVFTPERGDGLIDRFVLWRVGRLIEDGFKRGRARRSGPPIWYLEVWRIDDGETLVLEEQLTNPDAALRRIDDLVNQATAGDLNTGD